MAGTGGGFCYFQFAMVVGGICLQIIVGYGDSEVIGIDVFELVHSYLECNVNEEIFYRLCILSMFNPLVTEAWHNCF